MSKVWIIRKKQVIIVTTVLVLALILAYRTAIDYAKPVHSSVKEQRTIQLVTGEFKSTTKDGKTIEAYRWDPGTIIVNKGETVTLSFYGVNGESHPFIIEGTDIKGEVKKGEETTVQFTGSKKGTYRLICLTHPDITHNGPMIAYIVVI